MLKITLMRMFSFTIAFNSNNFQFSKQISHSFFIIYMKSQPFVLLVLVALFAFSCADDLTDIGTGIQPKSDEIKIGTDTFHVSTENVFVDYMFSRQDSFLLGTFYNEKYGSTQADILAQVNCPVDFKYPPGSVPDSALVRLYYRTWFGDSYSPLDVNIYEMNKKTFQYSTSYPSNLNPDEYTDRSILLGRRAFTAKDASGTRTSSTSIEFKLSNDFVQRFFDDSKYESESKFADFFKGMFITANFGASTILNVMQIDLEYYYHYKYLKNGKDTTIKSVVTFPANSEVRQVNRFSHPDRNSMVKESDDVNYIASPANLQTRVKLPLIRMKQRIDAALLDKKMTVNSALLGVEATEVDQATLAVPIVSYMLLIKEDSVDNFFKKNKLPDKKYAIVGQYAYSQIGTTSEYNYYYTFDVATVVANELKINPTNLKDLNMRLVPVRVKTDTNGSVTEVKQQFLMSAVTVKSGKNAESPMRVNMFFSGF